MKKLLILLFLVVTSQANSQVKEVSYGDTSYMTEVDSNRYRIVKVFELKPNLSDGVYKVNKKINPEGGNNKTYLHTVATYKNGKREGKYFEYGWPNTIFLNISNYKKGVLEGEKKSYYLDGEDSLVSGIGTYANGKKEGVWLEYSIQRRQKYKSKQMEYYRVIAKIENYKDGVEDGISYKFANGILVAIREYSKGNLIRHDIIKLPENKK